MTLLEGQNHTSDEELYELIDERIMEYGQARYLPLKERVDPVSYTHLRAHET